MLLGSFLGFPAVDFDFRFAYDWNCRQAEMCLKKNVDFSSYESYYKFRSCVFNRLTIHHFTDRKTWPFL